MKEQTKKIFESYIECITENMFEPSFILTSKSTKSDFDKGYELINKNKTSKSVEKKYIDMMFNDLKNGINFSSIKFDDSGYFYTSGELVLDPGDVERFYYNK